jgi:anti-sigma factor RsiW
MKTIDEEIWDYLDGGLTADQTAEISAKIDSDPAYQQAYTELQEVHQLMKGAELEEPSMSFTRNVMDQVKLEIAPIALKTKVSKTIIYSIAAFFLLSIMALMVYTIANSTLSDETFKVPSLKLPVNTQEFITPTSIRIFFFVDIVLALIYLDSFLRRKKA